MIPKDMRARFKEGEKLLIINYKNRIILKKASDMNEQLKKDLEFSRRTEEAWKRYDRGEFTSIDSENFAEEMMKWSVKLQRASRSGRLDTLKNKGLI